MVRRRSFLLAFIVLLSSCILVIYRYEEPIDPLLVSDVSGLEPIYVREIITGETEASIIETVKDANEFGVPVSIAGKQHSMGGTYLLRRWNST